MIGDSWFASVKTAEACAEYGHEFIGPVKTATRLFPKEELENTMKNWPGGTYIVLEGTSPNGHSLISIGYKYNKRKVLCFVATKNAGKTTLGDPYHARFLDGMNNVVSRNVNRPDIISH